MQAQTFLIQKPIPFLDSFCLEAPLETLREVIGSQRSDEEIQHIVFKILSRFEPKKVACCLNPIQAAKLADYVQVRVQKIAQAVKILNQHVDLKSELWRSCSRFQAFKKAVSQLEYVYLSFHRLNASQAKAILKEFSEKEEGKWKKLTTKLGKLKIPKLPLGAMTEVVRRQETAEECEARIKAMTAKNQAIFEQSIPLFLNSLNACLEVRKQWLSDAAYTKYATQKQAMYATLYELASFCTLKELSRQPEMSKDAIKWIKRNCISDNIVLMESTLI